MGVATVSLSAIGRCVFLACLALMLGLAMGFLTGMNSGRGGSLGRGSIPSVSDGTSDTALVVGSASSSSSVAGSLGKGSKRGPNYAARTNGATVSGCHRPNFLIDGNAAQFSGTTGFSFTDWTQKPTPAMLITLKKPTKLNTIRFLLWDLDDRYYRYKLDVNSSPTNSKWTTLADYTDEDQRCRGWQVVGFDEQIVSTIRLTGTFNSEDNGFHVVELQAFDLPEPLRHSSGAGRMEF